MSSSAHGLLDAAWQHFQEARPLMPMYTHLLLAALFPIYAGAHASLSRPASAAKPKKKNEDEELDEEEEEEAVQQMEGLSPQDAIVFPVTAAIVLAGLYFLIKRFGADMINLVLGYYFAGVGIYSVGRLVNDTLIFVLSFVFPTYLVKNRQLFKVNSKDRKFVTTRQRGGIALDSPSPLLPSISILSSKVWSVRSLLKQKYATEGYIQNLLDFKYNLTIVNLLSAILGLVSILYANFANKPWWLTNLQGFAVCYSAFQLMSPTTFATGSLILSGLFFYDIWAVFFTPLMVTVAKNIDQPIKLVFPRPEEPSETPGEPPTRSYSMLGLGDIVLPGLMIGLALRFDLYMFYLRKQKRSMKTRRGSSKRAQVVEKATYTAATGGWGNRFWTLTLPSDRRPENLKSFPKPYFTAAMVGYTLGMLSTLAVMSVFQHAQPALLYLVPGVLISLWTCGLVRGEIKEMWDYTEAITGESLDGDEDSQENDDKKKNEDEGRREGESFLQYFWRSLAGEEQKVDDGAKASKPDKEEEVDHNEKMHNSREGVIFAFSVSKLDAEKAPKKKDKKLSRDPEQSQGSDNSDDVIVVQSPGGLTEETMIEPPMTRSRSTRRRKL